MPNAAKQKYYEDNKNERKSYQKKYYEENKETIKRRKELREETDPEWLERTRKYNREYYRKNKKHLHRARLKRAAKLWAEMQKEEKSWVKQKVEKFLRDCM